LLVYDKEEPVTENLITWVFDENSFVPAAKLVGDKSYSILTDHLGTPYEAYDENGEKVWARELDLYGNAIAGDSSFIPFLYQAQYYDEEIGLAYNRFRYYSPESDTYISQDPIRLAGNNPNFYGYTFDSNTEVDVWGLTIGDRTFKYVIQQGDSNGGWVHIDLRHVSGGHSRGEGDLFTRGTTREHLEKAANKIVKKGKRITKDITKKMQSFEMKIKIKGNKKELVRVYVDTIEKKIITIFPARGNGNH